MQSVLLIMVVNYVLCFSICKIIKFFINLFFYGIIFPIITDAVKYFFGFTSVPISKKDSMFICAEG